MSAVYAKHLYKAYKNCNGLKVSVVDDVSFEIEKGEVFGLIGNNGAGKTTTIKMVCGITLPDAGNILICGKKPCKSRSQNLLGTLLEGNRNLYWRLSSLENIVYFGVIKGLSIREAKDRAKALLDRFEFTKNIDTLVQNLSRGMQQKLAIITSLVHSPRVLVLDEPTLGLDVSVRDMFSQFIQEIATELKVSVLLTSHDIEFIEKTASSYGVIRSGSLIKKGLMSELCSWVDSSGYSVNLSESLQKETLEKLSLFGNDVKIIQGNSLFVSKDKLYQVLEVMKPVNILHINTLGNCLEEMMLNNSLDELE